MENERDQLTTLVRQQSAGIEAWEAAELHLLERALLERFQLLGIEPTAEVGVALMAVATLLGDAAPEWGGDARDALVEVGRIGLRLLEGDDAS